MIICLAGPKDAVSACCRLERSGADSVHKRLVLRRRAPQDLRLPPQVASLEIFLWHTCKTRRSQSCTVLQSHLSQANLDLKPSAPPHDGPGPVTLKASVEGISTPELMNVRIHEFSGAHKEAEFLKLYSPLRAFPARSGLIRPRGHNHGDLSCAGSPNSANKC